MLLHRTAQREVSVDIKAMLSNSCFPWMIESARETEPRERGRDRERHRERERESVCVRACVGACAELAFSHFTLVRGQNAWLNRISQYVTIRRKGDDSTLSSLFHFHSLFLLFSSFLFHFFHSVFKHVDIYTYTRHTHKYKIDGYKLYNGVNSNRRRRKKDKTAKIVRTSKATGRHS